MKATVLLADYDPCSACRLRGLLAALGLQSILAQNGAAAIAAFERERPDLTLLQDLLPGKHGFAVCRELKQTEHGRRSPILLIADVRSRRRHDTVLSTGCDGYITKPVDGRILARELRELLPGIGWPAIELRVHDGEGASTCSIGFEPWADLLMLPGRDLSSRPLRAPRPEREANFALRREPARPRRTNPSRNADD